MLGYSFSADFPLMATGGFGEWQWQMLLVSHAGLPRVCNFIFSPTEGGGGTPVKGKALPNNYCRANYQVGNI